MYITEPFYSIFRKIYWKFFRIDALFLLGLYIINIIGEYFIHKTHNLFTSMLLVFFISLSILVIYSFCKFFQYKYIKKKNKYYEILAKHLFIIIILLFISFILLGLIFKSIELLFLLQYVLIIQRTIGIIILFYIYLLFLNTHNYDNYSSIRAIRNSIYSLSFRKILKILYFDSVYLLTIYLIHSIITFGFQYLLVYLSISLEILNPIYEFLEVVLFIILMITILSMNKIIIYKLNNDYMKTKIKTKNQTKNQTKN